MGGRKGRCITFLTASSRADLISDRFAMFTLTVGRGSEAREGEDGPGDGVIPFVTALRGAIFLIQDSCFVKIDGKVYKVKRRGCV